MARDRPVLDFPLGSHMPTKTVPVLDTPHLRLRALRGEDAPAIYAYAHDAAVARFVSWPRHRSLDDATAFLKYAAQAVASGRELQWALARRDDDTLVGAATPLGAWVCDGSRYPDRRVGFRQSRSRPRVGLLSCRQCSVGASAGEGRYGSRRTAQRLGCLSESRWRSRRLLVLCARAKVNQHPFVGRSPDDIDDAQPKLQGVAARGPSHMAELERLCPPRHHGFDPSSGSPSRFGPRFMPRQSLSVGALTSSQRVKPLIGAGKHSTTVRSLMPEPCYTPASLSQPRWACG